MGGAAPKTAGWVWTFIRRLSGLSVIRLKGVHRSIHLYPQECCLHFGLGNEQLENTNGHHLVEWIYVRWRFARLTVAWHIMWGLR
jgi:hypothetical protein